MASVGAATGGHAGAVPGMRGARLARYQFSDADSAPGRDRSALYIAPILANVVSDGYGEHVERIAGPPRLLASQEAVPAARHRDHGRRRDGGHDLGAALLRQDRLGAARRPVGDADRGPAARAPDT